MSEFIEDPESLSGNDLGGETEPVTPEPEGPGTETPEPGKDENQEGNKEQDKAPEENAGDQQEDTGRDQQPDIEDILERLDLLDMQKDDNVSDLTESIRSLVDLMSTDQYQPRDIYIPPDIPIDGYMAWDYPITVDYIISIVGYEEMVPQSAAYDDPEQFLEDFQDMAWNCYLGTVFKDFYIDKAYDAGGNKVYDSQPETEPEPEPGEKEPNETAAQLLSHLETISTTLAEMQQTDLEYYQAVYDYQADMLEMQSVDTVCSIALCIGLFAILAAMIWEELFWRFK